MKWGRWECNMVGHGAGVCMWEPSKHTDLTADEQFVENMAEDPDFKGVKILEPNVPKFTPGDNKEDYLKTLIDGQNQRGKIFLED